MWTNRRTTDTARSQRGHRIVGTLSAGGGWTTDLPTRVGTRAREHGYLPRDVREAADLTSPVG